MTLDTNSFFLAHRYFFFFFCLSLSQLLQVGSPTWKWIRWQKESTDLQSLQLALQPIGVFFGSSSNSTLLAEKPTGNREAICRYYLTPKCRSAMNRRTVDYYYYGDCRGRYGGETRTQPLYTPLCMAVILSSIHTYTHTVLVASKKLAAAAHPILQQTQESSSLTGITLAWHTGHYIEKKVRKIFARIS